MGLFVSLKILELSISTDEIVPKISLLWVQPKKPIVRGIQEIKHEPNLSLDNQQNLAVAYCHVVILDMEGEGTLSSGSTWIFFLPSRISHVFATDPCGHRMRRYQDLQLNDNHRQKLRSGHLTCRDLVHQNMPSPVHSSCTLVTQQILATSFLPMFKSKAST